MKNGPADTMQKIKTPEQLHIQEIQMLLSDYGICKKRLILLKP